MNVFRIQNFQISLAAAKNHEAQGQFALAFFDFSSAILDLLSVAMLDFGQSAEGIIWMESQGVMDLLIKCEELVKRLPESEELVIFSTMAVAHIASLLNRHEMAEYLVGRTQQPGRHFWNEYARAMQCLVTKEPYEPKLGTLKGSQKYRVPCLTLISDITNGRDLSGSLEAMRQSFQRRQADKRITDDGGLIVEGSEKQPTHWDFRAEALKAYVTYKYELTFT